MRSEIQAARAREGRTAQLAAEAHQAREKLDDYEAGSDAAEMGSPGRLRDLQRESEAADARLERLQTAPPEHRAEELDPNPEAADVDHADDDDEDGGVRAL